MENKHMVYVHKRKTDGSVFYVGIGKGRRPYVVSGRNQHWKNVAQKNGLEVEILYENMNQSCAKTIERILINKIGLINLCNITPGGEGTSGWVPSPETCSKISKSVKKAWIDDMFDGVWTEERRKKMSKRISGDQNPMFGKSLTDEHKSKISDSLKGEKHPNYGKEISKETKRKLSLAIKGRALSKEHKEAISRGLKGKKQSKESIEKRAASREKKEIFTFVNRDGREFTGTMRGISKKFNLDRSTITKIVNGKQKSCKGWSVK